MDPAASGNSTASPTAVPDFWIFGYGSLIWRPAFPFLERRAGFIEGYRRRFWQASPDHRGTVEQPGRVLTLVPADAKSSHVKAAANADGTDSKSSGVNDNNSSSSRVFGVAFLVAGSNRESVLAYLDDRESGGYSQATVDVMFANGESVKVAGIRFLLQLSRFAGKPGAGLCWHERERALHWAGRRARDCASHCQRSR